jgi:glyoxylase-like metal-dependent hydrolase (beta-lactamase superfamily II)
MRVAPGVEMLELSAILMNGPGILYPTALWDQDNAILVDAGLPGMARQFIEAMEQAGVPQQKLTSIIVTHHDLDHIGSLKELQERIPHRVEIWSHREEVPYIRGEIPPVKTTPRMMAQMAEQMKGLPEEQRQAMRAMAEKVKGLKLKVDRVISDGEVLPNCGGLQIIHTPGHTPGHICLYHSPSKTLIAGDALFVEGNNLGPAPAFINADIPLALSSLKKLARCDVARVIAYHGGLFQNSPNTRIAEIVA